MRILRNIIGTTVGLFALAALAAMPVAADFVILDDLIVDGSACIGFDCVNGESFGFDTIRIKENNLRIKALDTSTAASFPTQDWQLTFNDSANGGTNKFAIDAISPVSRTMFVIEDDAQSNAIYATGSKVGFGTNNPSVEVHIVDGDTPTLRLEQDGSSGFTPQTWDVAGNETNFFVRDVTNGSLLPFRIRPGADSSAILIDPDGNIGNLAGTSPGASFHVKRSDGTARILVEETQSPAGLRPLFTMSNFGPPQFQMENTDSAITWDFRMNNPPNNDFTINNAGGLGLAFRIDQGTGDVFIAAGQLQVVSSRDKKRDFEALDSVGILDLVGSLPLTSWSYKKDTDGTRHIGPVAEDFYATFGVGADERFLSPSDVSGVALAAIQGLQQVVQSKDARINDLEARLAALEAALGVAP